MKKDGRERLKSFMADLPEGQEEEKWEDDG